MDSIWYFIRSRLLRDWKSASEADAKRNPYYGIRGWLLIFYLTYLWGFLQGGYEWILPSSPILLETYSGNLVFKKVVETVYLFLIAAILFLMPLKHPLLPKVWMGSMWISFLIAVFVRLQNFPGGPENVDLGLAGLFIIFVLISWYILNSKRVSVTFLHRIPAKAELVSTGALTADDRAKRNQRIFWVIGGILALLIFAGLVVQFDD